MVDDRQADAGDVEEVLVVGPRHVDRVGRCPGGDLGRSPPGRSGCRGSGRSRWPSRAGSRRARPARAPGPDGDRAQGPVAAADDQPVDPLDPAGPRPPRAEPLRALDPGDRARSIPLDLESLQTRPPRPRIAQPSTGVDQQPGRARPSLEAPRPRSHPSPSGDPAAVDQDGPEPREVPDQFLTRPPEALQAPDRALQPDGDRPLRRAPGRPGPTMSWAMPAESPARRDQVGQADQDTGTLPTARADAAPRTISGHGGPSRHSLASSAASLA